MRDLSINYESRENLRLLVREAVRRFERRAVAAPPEDAVTAGRPETEDAWQGPALLMAGAFLAAAVGWRLAGPAGVVLAAMLSAVAGWLLGRRTGRAV